MANFINMDKLLIRPLMDKDWKIINSWREQGWMGNTNDSILTLASKLNHCQLTVIVDENDIPLSYLSVRFYKDFVYIGLYITDPIHRGKGIGKKLWDSVTSKFNDRNIYLKSRPEMTEKYCAISNFTFKSSVTCLRFVGIVNQDILQKMISKEKTEKPYSFSSLINKSIVERIAKYDSNLRGEDTTNFVTVWLSLCEVTSSNINPSIFTVCASNDHGEVVGYGSIAQNRNGRRIGPLIADSYEIFLLLFKELINHRFPHSTDHSDEITMAIPSSNQNVAEFVSNINFQLTVSLDRSFTKSIVDFHYDRIYCFAGHLGMPE